jgi:uncharacterized protein (DUF362 family)
VKTRMTRRAVITAGAVALAGCARTKRPGGAGRHAEAPVVSIVRQPGYTQDIYETVRRTLAGHHLDVRGKSVVLKPNLVEFEAGSVINTNPLFVHAAMEAFKAMGASSVRIAEGPGHRRGTLDLAEAAGYFKTIPGFEDLFTDLNLDDVSRIRFAHPVSRLESLYLPHTALSCDLLVSMPKMKTHHWAVATLSMKNLFGVVPGGVYGWPKNVLHWAGIAECITDIQTVFPRAFALVDGIVGMEGNGPIQGTPRASGVIVAGRDMAAVDATCCRLMRIDPLHVEYLRLSRAGADLAAGAIRQDGESIDRLSTTFELLPQFVSARLPNGRADRVPL